MATLGLIFGNAVRAEISTMVLDASLSENHELSAEITDNEIEDGSNVSDHVRLKPQRLTINGLISSSPLTNFSAGIGTIVTASTAFVSQAVGPSLLGNVVSTLAGTTIGSLAGLVNLPPRKPEDAYKFLEEIWKKREPFSVVTKLKRYENMIITSLSVPRSASVGDSLQFTATLQQVTIVKTQTIEIPAFKIASGSKARGASTASLGKQATKTPATATGEKGSSIAFAGAKKFGFFGG